MDNICTMCPRNCNAVRNESENKGGFCKTPWNFKVARASLHFWEEPCISGKSGSGTIFFSGCNLKCVYCQNHQISHSGFGATISDNQFVEICESLIAKGANNINLVNPTHYAVQLANLFEKYHPTVPVIYNSSGYESVETLQLLEGKVDVYLPDLKYSRNEKSSAYSGVENYFEIACKAILEMARQVGANEFDENGIIQKGMIVRHLILPENTNSAKEILEWISKNICKGNQISVMSQYIPTDGAEKVKEINRKITLREYEKVTNFAELLGIENGYFQELNSANNIYVPDFNLQGILDN